MITKMKNKTYRNFLIIKNMLMQEKGYASDEASNLTHLIFNNYELDNSRTIRDYYDRILTKEQFEMQ